MKCCHFCRSRQSHSSAMQRLLYFCQSVLFCPKNLRNPSSRILRLCHMLGITHTPRKMKLALLLSRLLTRPMQCGCLIFATSPLPLRLSLRSFFPCQTDFSAL